MMLARSFVEGQELRLFDSVPVPPIDPVRAWERRACIWCAPSISARSSFPSFAVEQILPLPLMQYAGQGFS